MLLLPPNADGMATSTAANVRSQARSGTLGNEILPLWVGVKAFNKKHFLFPVPKIETGFYGHFSCSVYAGCFSSECADE